MEFLRNAISIQKNIENSGRPHREEPYFRGQTRDIHSQRQGAYPGFCQALPVKFMYIINTEGKGNNQDNNEYGQLL